MFPSQTNPTRVTHFNRGYGYAVSGVSGTVAAGLAQDIMQSTAGGSPGGLTCWT